MARSTKLKAAMTKTQMLADIAESTDLSKKQVASVFEALEGVIGRHVAKGAVGICTVPVLMKMDIEGVELCGNQDFTARSIDATPARWRNWLISTQVPTSKSHEEAALRERGGRRRGAARGGVLSES